MRVRTCNPRGIFAEDPGEKVTEARPSGTVRAVSMRGQDFACLIANSHRGMQGARRFLRNQGDVTTANRIQIPWSCGKDVFPGKKDFALLDHSSRRKQI